MIKMGHKNYSKFSEHFKKNKEQNSEVIEGQIAIDEVVKPEVAETVSGIVSGCKKLNMRENSDKESNIITTLVENTELVINLIESTEEFYKVCTASGLEGYCMKKFITIR